MFLPQVCVCFVAWGSSGRRSAPPSLLLFFHALAVFAAASPSVSSPCWCGDTWTLLLSAFPSSRRKGNMLNVEVVDSLLA